MACCGRKRAPPGCRGLSASTGVALMRSPSGWGLMAHLPPSQQVELRAAMRLCPSGSGLKLADATLSVLHRLPAESAALLHPKEGRRLPLILMKQFLDAVEREHGRTLAK